VPTYLVPPPGASAADIKEIEAFNSALRSVTKSLTRNDVWIGVGRTVVLFVLAAATVASGVALILSIPSAATSPAATIVSGAGVLASLTFGTLINPLQTVERDVVYRRWSDTIINSFVMQVAGQSELPELRAASQLASDQFAALAASYSALAGKASPTAVTPAAPASPASPASATAPQPPAKPTKAAKS
jgi:hypothetical protein